MNFCMDFLRPAAGSTTRMPLFLDRLRWQCIDTIPVHMPDKLNQCIRPCSKRIPCCKWSCSVYWLTVDSMAFGRRRNWDRGSHCRRDIDRRISACTRWCSRDLAMDCSWRALSTCMVFDRAAGAMSSGNNKCPCSPLPSRNHILRPDRLHHCHRLLVAVLQERGRMEEKCKLNIYPKPTWNWHHIIVGRTWAFTSSSSSSPSSLSLRVLVQTHFLHVNTPQFAYEAHRQTKTTTWKLFFMWLYHSRWHFMFYFLAPSCCLSCSRSFLWLLFRCGCCSPHAGDTQTGTRSANTHSQQTIFHTSI